MKVTKILITDLLMFSTLRFKNSPHYKTNKAAGRDKVWKREELSLRSLDLELITPQLSQSVRDPSLKT